MAVYYANRVLDHLNVSCRGHMVMEVLTYVGAIGSPMRCSPAWPSRHNRHILTPTTLIPAC